MAVMFDRVPVDANRTRQGRRRCPAAADAAGGAVRGDRVDGSARGCRGWVGGRGGAGRLGVG